MLTFASIIYSQPKYKVSDIPKDLLTGAKAVVRKSETTFEITGIDKAVKTVTYAITILNQNGIDKSVFHDFYDKFLKIRKIEWDIYDQSGNRVRNNTSVQVKDYSAISGYSLFEDNRVKFVDPNYRTTPFTVEYNYEEVYNGLLFYPEWKLYDDFNISVENSSLTVITPKGFHFRYYQKNMPDSCKSGVENEKSWYKWVAVNKPAIKEEPFSVPLEEYTPVVYTAPDDFEFGGYKGNLESWMEFGKWINKINKGRDALSPETTSRIKQLAEEKKSQHEKIEALYRYLQEKVRYVSVQVGIGGWQTIDAETVDRLSYGDCKALANYMKSLLDIAGIKSYYTLVEAGADAPEMLRSFPSNQFNHAFICIPEKNDTVWLECTSQQIPAGYLGKFTDDRDVLLIADSGGIVVKTRKYNLNDNIQIRNATVSLTGEGNAESSVITTYKGILYDDIFEIFMMDETDRREYIQKRIPIQSFDLKSFKYTEIRESVPSAKEELNLILPNYGILTGDHMIFNPNLLARFGKLPYSLKDRKSEIYIKRPYILTDSIIFKLPLNYKVELVPQNSRVNIKFGEYSTDLSYDNRELRYVRKFKFFRGSYPASEYGGFVNFCENISASDERKVILVKIY
jgi:transglutaminase-like putative cysteine protease